MVTARFPRLPRLAHRLYTMNFFDTFDVSRSATPTAQSESIQDNSARPQPEVTLNEEVNQVVGQLGRLWGGFRKQVRYTPLLPSQMAEQS